jgi:hypothetical protein
MLWYNNIDIVWSEYETTRQNLEGLTGQRLLRLARNASTR